MTFTTIDATKTLSGDLYNAILQLCHAINLVEGLADVFGEMTNEQAETLTGFSLAGNGAALKNTIINASSALNTNADIQALTTQLGYSN